MPPPLLRTALRALAISLPGIALVPFVIEPPQDIPAALLMVNPFVLAVVMSLAGAATAPRLGLSAEWILNAPYDGAKLRLGLIVGLAAGATAAMIDQIWAPHWQTPDMALPTLLEGTGPLPLLLGVVYGGVTEEVLVRWGLLSALLWLGSKVLSRRAAVWAATAIAALLFAAGHLPGVLASGAELTPALLARILGLNTALGIVYGLLFVRKSLGTAMAAHAGTHLAVFLLALIW